MKAFRTISAILLALLVLVSSTSFIIGMHFCMDEVQNMALFTKADNCEKEKSLPPCHRHATAACCDDQMVFHKGINFNASSEHIQFVAPVPIEVEQPLTLISEVIPSAPISHIKYYNYYPPLRSCDLTVEYQVFLI
jgi:hypothetical protein